MDFIRELFGMPDLTILVFIWAILLISGLLFIIIPSFVDVKNEWGFLDIGMHLILLSVLVRISDELPSLLLKESKFSFYELWMIAAMIGIFLGAAMSSFNFKKKKTYITMTVYAILSSAMVIARINFIH